MHILSGRALRWVAVVALGAPSAYAAEWSVQPALAVSADYDSNRTLARDAIGSEGVSMSGNMRLEHATERLQLILLPDIELQRFSERQYNRSDSGGSSAEAIWTGQLTSLDLTGLLRDQSTLAAELASTGIIDLNTRRRDEQVGGTWSYAYAQRWVLSLFSNYASQTYHGNATTPLQNNRLTSYGAAEKYIASDRLAFTLTLSTGHYTTEEAFFDTRSDTATAGFIWSSGERDKLTGDLGWNRRTDRFSRSSGFVGDLAFGRNWEIGSVTLSGGRSVIASGFGVFSQTDQAQFTASHNLSERLTSSVGLTWTRTTSAFQSFALDEHTYAQANVTLSWQANEYWSLACDVGAERQEFPLNHTQGHGWRAGLSASWHPLKYSLSR